MTMTDTSKNAHELTSILDLCREVIPYLDGKIEKNSPSPLSQQINNKWLIGHAQDYLTIQALRDDLTKQHPNAGDDYLKARTWHLLCWQPIYITFISIYGLQRLPDFTGFKQQRQHNAIVGFIFQRDELTAGSTEQLIPLAAIQLKVLFEHYRTQFDSLERCRPGYAGRFIADLILGNLLKVKEINPNFNDQSVLSDAALWLNSMDLPEKLINSLTIKENQPINFIRTSCCLADKINKKLCTDCPKAHKNSNR
ncbi:siderophore ferric iron reductase [Psychromonas sp. Urea-02u-13]|nr:siderophore ferric iron reductase [Psychromonas sp. Urea-02u-13]